MPMLKRPWPDDIDVALHRLDDEDIEAWSRLLSRDEQARAERFRRPDDRRRSLLGRGVLRSMLAPRLNCDPASLVLGVDGRGKPTLVGPSPIGAEEIAFNVSHSGDYVLVAVGRAQAIGVDVEQHRRDLDLIGVGRQVFTSAERAALEHVSDELRFARFFRQWTLKEAVAKAVGLGLALDLKRFEVLFAEDTPFLATQGVDELGSAASWTLATLAVCDDYSAALAARPWGNGGGGAALRQIRRSAQSSASPIKA